MKIADHHALFLADGEINKRGITMAAYTVMAPLVKSIGKTATPSAPALEWLCHAITALYNMALRGVCGRAETPVYPCRDPPWPMRATHPST